MASGGEPQRFCDPSEMVQLYAHLGKGELSPETVELHGLRVVHRQRFGKHLQFVGLRCPLGTSVEAILKGGVFEPAPNVELASAFRLGDVVSVTGQVEMSECRLSVKAQKAEVLESWQALFGKQVFHDSLPSTARIEHLPMLLERALPLLRARGAAFDLYCCDMNAPPLEAVDLLLATLPLLRAGARIVLTFKSGAEKKHEWQKVVDAQLERLRRVADEVQVLHLFANTSNECTVVCRLAARLDLGARLSRCCRALAGRT